MMIIGALFFIGLGAALVLLIECQIALKHLTGVFAHPIEREV
jgi:hypothetical protein